MSRKWPTPPPMVRVSVLLTAGVLLTGAALWAGANGPWVGRPQGADAQRSLPDLTDLPTVPTRQTVPPIPPPSTGGAAWDPTAVLYILGAILLGAVVLMVAAMVRNSGRVASGKRQSGPEPDQVTPAVQPPDPDRPFDSRAAADYVIACWEQLEQQAASRGTARRREQTPTEFISALQATYPLDQRACAELLGLYQRARFDHVRLLPDTAVRARTCADVLLAALRSAQAAL